jgi:hypothetical protein
MFLPGFSQLTEFTPLLRRFRYRKKSRKDTDPMKEMTPAEWRTAPKILHPPVDELHSIDFPAHNGWLFLLTIKMKGVKTTSFFDSF